MPKPYTPIALIVPATVSTIPRFPGLSIIRGFFKSRMTFEKATLNLCTFRSASCGTQEARETARGLSKLTEF
jgi:hypothetical protein